MELATAEIRMICRTGAVTYKWSIEDGSRTLLDRRSISSTGNRISSGLFTEAVSATPGALALTFEVVSGAGNAVGFAEVPYPNTAISQPSSFVMGAMALLWLSIVGRRRRLA